MTRLLLLLLLLCALLVVAVLATGAPAARTSEESAEPQVVVAFVDGVSFEELLSIPEVRQLARSGGAGMLSVRTTDDDEGLGPWVTIGAGARSWGPKAVQIVKHGEGLAISGADAIRARNEGRSVPGLLADTLTANGRRVGTILGDFDPENQGPVALARADGFVGDLSPPVLAAVTVYSVDPSALGEALGVPRARALRLVGQDIRSVVTAAGEGPVLVIVASPAISPEMQRAGDELPGIALARGTPETVFVANGELHTLTSATTRRAGLVSNEDIAPALLDYFGIPIPGEMKGTPIRVVGEPPPFELHERHLAARQRRTPVLAGAGVAVLLEALVILLCAPARRRGSARAGRLGAWLALSIPVLMAALLAAGVIAAAPMAVLAAFLAASSFGVAALAMWLGRGSTIAPAAITGAAILVYFLVDAAFGFPSMLTTFLGSQGFDGGRYYGIHNVDIGLLLGAACFLAAAIRPYAGFVVLVLTGILLSFPGLGANHGGGGTVFFAAGLWLALDGTWNRMTLRRWIAAILITLAGVVLIFVADAIASVPTHGTRFLHTEGVAGFLPRLWERMEIGFRLIAQSPGGLVYLALTPVLLYVTIRPRGRLRATLEAEPRWRAAIAVILGASILSFFINDTGVAAVALGFGSGAVGLLYISLMRSVRTG